MARARAGWLDDPEAPADASGAVSMVRSVKRHPVIVTVVALAAVVAAALWLSARSDSYEATASILVTPAPDDGGPDRSLPLLRSSGDRTRIVQTAASLIDSAGAAEGAARRLGAGWTQGRVADAVAVEPVGQTDVVAVTATSDSPALAARIANEFARAALTARARALRPRIEQLKSQLQSEISAEHDPASQVAVDLQESLSAITAVEDAGDPTLSLTRLATAPSSPAGTASWLLLALALVAGLAVGVGAAMVADLIGPPSVADAAHAAALAGAPVLARIPAARAGRSPPPAVVRAARRLELRLAGHGSSPAAVLVTDPAEGGDAAACVAGLGLALAQAGRAVLVVNLDSTGVVERRLDGADPGQGSLRVHRRGVPTQKQREGYDLLLVHAPSIVESGGAARAAGAVDAVVLVVRPRRTKADDVELAIRLLERAGRRPDAVILVTDRWLHARILSALRRPPVPAAVGESHRELDLPPAR